MEDMGMTNEQWKDNLRIQLENWEEIEDFLNSDKTDDALKKSKNASNRVLKAESCCKYALIQGAGLPLLPFFHTAARPIASHRSRFSRI